MSGDRAVVLEARDITHAFAASRSLVLRDVSLSAARGEFVALVGASGSGKTTLLRVIGGLLQPDEGRVLVGGNEVTGRPSLKRAHVFQSDRLFPWMTTLQNVTIGLTFRGDDRRAAEARGSEALQLVGLGGYAGAYPSELSGGMRQRVNVARALVLDPDFLLMDEPFAALDAQTRELMQAELLRILQETSVGVVFVTHQIEEALYLADRVLVLGARPGHVRCELSVPFPRPRDLSIKRDPRFQELYDRVWREIEADVRAGMLPADHESAPDPVMAGGARDDH